MIGLSVGEAVNSSPRGTTTVLTLSRVDEVAQILARAMNDDPAYGYLFPDERTRDAALSDFFRGHLRNHVPHRCSHLRIGADGRVEATVTIRPPGGIPLTIPLLARSLLPFAFARGWTAVRRLFALKEAYEALEARVGEGQLYEHVHMMAVRPDLQGRGIGAALLADALSAVTRKHPLVLTTHRRRNVHFYERAGFGTVIETEVHLPEGEPYPVYGMRRPPG